MPKKLFKRMIPDMKKSRENKYLKVFGRFLDNHNLWHFHRYSVSMAISIALFCAFIPLPIHTFVGIVLAIALHANIPICLVFIWINTPITYFPIFYFAFRVGAFILGTEPIGFHFEMSRAWLSTELHHIWKPFLVGCTISAITFAILGNILIRVLWRCSVSRQWKKRQKRLLAHKKTQSTSMSS